MSFQATRFILGLTDLNSSQKAVAHTLAYHANKYGGNSYPSMETIARESGLQSRRSAQRVVRQLEKKRIIVAMTAKTGGRGQDKATVYRLDLDYKSPINSDTTVALSDQQTATPGSQFTVEKQRPVGQESVTPETIKRDIQGRKQRRPGHTNSNEELRRVCEEGDQEPHTTSFKNTMEEKEVGEVKPNQTLDSPPSTNNTVEKRAREVKPDQTSVPPPSKNNITPNHPVHASKKECVVAPEVARLQAEILRIPLTNGRTFQCNGKMNSIIAQELTKGRSAALILQAANYIGRALPDRDRMPGLTLADNLAARIIAMELEQAAAVEEQERRVLAAEQHRRDIERLEREQAAKVEIKREEVAAKRERSDWMNEHGNCDAFIPTNPAVLYRADLEDRVERAYRDGSINRAELWVEAKKLQAEALQAQLAAEGDGEPEPFY